MSLSLSYYSAIKTAAPTAWSWIVSSTLSLSLSLSGSLYSLTEFNAAPAHVVILIGVLFYLILIFHLHYYHIHTHTYLHAYTHRLKDTHKQKFIHTNVCSQFTAVFCFSPLAFSIAFALTRSLRRLLLPYAHPSPPLPSTSTSLPTS